MKTILAAALFTVICAAQAQTYPTKPIKLVTEFIGGSGGDALLRLVMAPVAQSMGQPIVIDSHAGAGGLVAAEQVARAEPDGYTWLAGAPNVHTVRPWLTRTNNPFDSLKQLTPITTVAEPYMGIIVHPSVPARNMKQLLDHARANPGKVAYASSGIGSTFHLDAELIQQLTGVQLVQVPYKALQQAMGDVISNQIPVSFVLAGQANGHVKAGKLAPIAIVGEQRYPEWPDVAPISETVPGFEAPAAWTGLFGPANLPQALVQRIYKEVATSQANPAVKAKLAAIGVETKGIAPDAFATHIRRQKELIGRIVKTAGIKPID
jgi:tripartite-type tricarboxylate transporter receptor subunit TctC